MLIIVNILLLLIISIISYFYNVYILQYVLTLISLEFHNSILIFIIIIVQLDNLILYKDLNDLKINNYNNSDNYSKIIIKQALEIQKLKNDKR